MYKKTNTSLQVQPFVSLLALKIPTGRKHSGLKPFHTTSNTSCYMVSLESFTTYRHQKVVRKYFGFHLFCYIGTREERGKINCTKIINTRIPVIKPSLLLSLQMNVCLSINFPFCIFSAQVSYTKHKNFIFLEQCFCSQGKHQKTRGFQGDRKIPVAWNGLNIVGFFCFYFFIFYFFLFFFLLQDTCAADVSGELGSPT